MRLYIAEKPSLGRAIAAALPGPQEKAQGWIRCGSGDEVCAVSWCVGHLLEPAEPGDYEARWQRWQLAELPIFPQRWKLNPKASVKGQLKVLEQLLRKATEVIHAGDPDREGQLLVDEVLRYFRVEVPVKRVLINDLTPAMVARAVKAPRDNGEFRSLSHSALARQQADWLFGMNLTRYQTLERQRRGDSRLFSVGRVQTPVLGLVVERDKQIESFEPKPFFRIQADCAEADTSAEDSPAFAASWKPTEKEREWLDEEDRLLDKARADQIAGEVAGQQGIVKEAIFRDRSEAPPLPLSLSALQIEAARLYQVSARQVLDAAQNLYERHQLITYPRSDCRYLPESHFSQRAGVCRAISSVLPDLSDAVTDSDMDLRSAAWNDKKVDAHHAIIPTARGRAAGSLSVLEGQVYELIARYYLMQFRPPLIRREGKLTLQISEHLFRARESAVLEPGWKALDLRRKSDNHDEPPRPLPRLAVGDLIHCKGSKVLERTTAPPQPFTDATLLQAMTHIARFVDEPELKKTLRETDGLGTEATRAAIIEVLFRREYLQREKRFIRSTDKGKELIGMLPPSVCRPDTTAHWESCLESVRRGEADPKAFLDELRGQIATLIQPGEPSRDRTLETGADRPQKIHCPRCRASMRRRSGPHGDFMSCSRFPDCRGTRPADEPLPDDGTHLKPVPCPACFSPLVRRKGKKGYFWGCSGYPGCRITLNDIEGLPDLPARH